MKKLLIIAFALLISNSYAQTIDTSTYSKKIEYLFQNIEKPKNAGIWYDRIIPWAGLQSFGTEKNKHSSAILFKQAYYELLIADGRQEQYNKFLTATQLRKAIEVVPLGIIDAKIFFCR